MNKTNLLVKAEELNVPRQNCMKTKKELEKTIKETIIKYKEIIFGVKNPICLKYFDELQRSKYLGSLLGYKKIFWKRFQEKHISGW